jgi:hypothetical protein
VQALSQRPCRQLLLSVLEPSVLICAGMLPCRVSRAHIECAELSCQCLVPCCASQAQPGFAGRTTVLTNGLQIMSRQ